MKVACIDCHTPINVENINKELICKECKEAKRMNWQERLTAMKAEGKSDTEIVEALTKFSQEEDARISLEMAEETSSIKEEMETEKKALADEYNEWVEELETVLPDEGADNFDPDADAFTDY